MNDRNKYKPDLNAPRYTSKSYNLMGRDAFIKNFRKKFPEYKDMSEVQVRSIIKTFNETIVEEVIENRNGVELPEFCGRLFIGSCKRKKKPNVDFKKTADNNLKIQHRNFESDEFLAKIFYSTYEIKHAYKNHQLYAFKACRNFTRRVGKTYPSKWKLYVLIEPFKKITSVFKQNMKMLERKDITEEYL